MRFIPKGYRLLRVGEKYPVEYYYNAKSNIKFLNSRLINNWVFVRNENNAIITDRIRNNNYYYILVKK